MKRTTMCFVFMGFVATMANAQLLSLAEETTVFIEHEQDLVPQALKASEEAYEEFCIKYCIPKEQRQHLEELLEKREMRKMIYNYVYPNSAYDRACSKLSVDSVFQDSIDLVLIPFNSSIAGENISYALKTGKSLQLDVAQRKHIEQQALDMAHQLHKNPRANVWRQEMNVLRGTLSEKQLKRFFSLKNGVKVGTKLKEDWIKLIEAGLTAELDSAADRARASQFYHLQYQIMDLYKYENNMRNQYLIELNKQMPQWVKLIDAIEKRKRVNAHKNEVGKDYIW